MNVTFLSSLYTHAMHTPVNMHMCDAYIRMNVHAKTHNKQALKYAVLCVLIQGTLPFVPVNASGMLPPHWIVCGVCGDIPTRLKQVSCIAPLHKLFVTNATNLSVSVSCVGMDNAMWSCMKSASL